MDALEPAVIFEEPLEQTLIGVPALAAATGRIVRVFVAVPFVQPVLEAVSVNVTLPAVLSAALGL